MALSAAACGPRDGPGTTSEVQDRQAAPQLAVGDSLRTWPAASGAKPVVLYVDLSQSMRGFLDPQWHTHVAADYRHVISMVDAELAPTAIDGFGNGVRVVGRRALGTLDRAEIYGDGNTQLEDVFPRVLADSALASTHILIGDGRRGSPSNANAQYVQMRAAALQWIARGGSFAVAASQAPFTPVAEDPSGCRTAGEARPARHGGSHHHGGSAGEGETARHDAGESSHGTADESRCPLYAFAFIAPGEETRIVAALAGVFEHVFVTPIPAVADKQVHLRDVSPQARADIRLEPTWVVLPTGDVARARGLQQTSNPLPAEIALDDSTSELGRAELAAIRGQALETRVFVRALSLPAQPWQPTRLDAGLVVHGADALHPRFISYGAASPPALYRIELVPSGPPSWLDAFDADSAGDARRTYGLGRLFDAFPAAPGQPVVRAFVAAN